MSQTQTKTNGTTPYLYEYLTDGRMALYIDHHTLSGFRKCEAYFQLRNFYKVIEPITGNARQFYDIKAVRPRGRAFKRDIGIWWARTMEWYYTALSTGGLKKDTACDLAMQAWQQEKMDDLKIEFPSSYEKFGGVLGASQMIAEYYDFSYNFDMGYWKIIAIEAGFGRRREVRVAENDKVVVYWIGKPDLFINEGGRHMPVDHKTKDAILPRHTYGFKPHPQTAGYIIAAQEIARRNNLDLVVDRCLVNLAARMAPSDNPRSGVKRPRFQRIPVQYSQSELDEWRLQTLLKATRLRHCIEHDEWLWNEDACHAYSGCDYRAIHSSPPTTRPIIIQSQFTVGEPWIAYEPDED